MRFVAALLICLACSPTAFAQQPEYFNDRATRASIESQGTKLHEAGKTTDNATLQAQLAERRQHDAEPPASVELTQDGEAIFDAVDDGVIVVARLYLCGRCDRLHPGCASGFIVSECGLAVTNHHVMKSDDPNTVSFVAMTRHGKVYPITEVLASKAADDIALVRISAPQGHRFNPVPIARTAEVGERVHAITHPNGRFYQYASGEISRFFIQPKPRRQAPVKRISITAVFAKGSSGGPIFNDRGQVVAVVSSTRTVYYDAQDGDPRNPQMVFRDCVPYESILDLFNQPDDETKARADAR